MLAVVTNATTIMSPAMILAEMLEFDKDPTTNLLLLPDLESKVDPPNNHVFSRVGKMTEQC